MRLQHIKKEKDLPPIGDELVHRELKIVDGAIKGITLKFKSGKAIHAGVDGYSFQLMRPAEPVMVTRYRVSTTIADSVITRDFEDQHDAQEYRSRVKDLTVDCDVALSEVQVLEDEPSTPSSLDEVPF